MNLSIFQDETDALASLKAGNEKGLSYLFGKYNSKLFAYSFRFLKSKDLADEIVQETFLRIWKAKENIDSNQSFDQYIFRIARNLIIDSFRKLAKEKAFEMEMFARMQFFDNHTEEEFLYQELKVISQKAIERMPAQQRVVFTLSREDGLSYNEIAEKLNISVNTVKVHMLKSLNYLRQYLRQENGLYVFLFFTNIIVW